MGVGPRIYELVLDITYRGRDLPLWWTVAEVQDSDGGTHVFEAMPAVLKGQLSVAADRFAAEQAALAWQEACEGQDEWFGAVGTPPDRLEDT